MDKPSIGDLVSLRGWNGRVTNTATWADGRKVIEILWVKNIFRQQRAEVFDWAMIADTLEPSSTELIAGEILTTLLAQDVRIQEAFGK
jgi:hypothetical protein